MFILVLSHLSAIKAELTLTLQVAGWVFCAFFLLAVPAEMPQPEPFFIRNCHVVLRPLLVLLSELMCQTQEAVSCTLSTHVCSHSCLLSASCSLNLSHSVWFALLNSLPCPPAPPPLPSTVNKQPVPTPRRAGTVNKKPQLTSPTFQPTLPPLKAWVPAQPEPEPEVPSPAAEAEQPGPRFGWPGGGDGGGGGQNGGVQVAPVKPQVITQLSAEESR